MASRKTRLVRRIIIMLIFVVVVYGGVIGLHFFMGAKFLKAMASAPPPTISVSVVKASTRTWPYELEAVASLKAEQGTTLTAESSGTVTGLHFKSGQTVKQGQLLVQLNDNVARAQLAADQAKLINARQQVERQRKLFSRQATSQADLQAAEATYLETQAAVQSDRAKIANLQVRAPFKGHLGIRDVSLGQYVSPGTSVVSIQQWSPLRVEFNLPQSTLSRLAIGNTVELRVDGLPSRHFSGRITAMDASISSSTRTLAVQAKVDNAKQTLRPGMFGQVTVRLAQSQQVVAVPATAIAYSTYGEYVYVIKKTDHGQIAEQRIVKTGTTHDGEISLTKGIAAGETVVIAGQVKLYPGAHVKTVAAPSSLTASNHSGS